MLFRFQWLSFSHITVSFFSHGKKRILYIYKVYKAGCLAGMFEWHLPPIFLFLPPVFGQLRRSDAPAECDAIGPMPQGEKRRGFWTRPVLGGHRKDCCLML